MSAPTAGKLFIDLMGLLTYTFDKRGVAQWLARMVWDHEVGGSNPLTPTINRKVELADFFYSSLLSYQHLFVG